MNASSLLVAVVLHDFEGIILCLILLILCRIVLKRVVLPFYKYRKLVKGYKKILGVVGVGSNSGHSMCRKAC